MNKRSRSTLFLLEQLIAILVFAVCAAASVTILADSHLTAEESRDTRNSLLIAENAAECYKFTGGDHTETAMLLGATTPSIADNIAIIYYDINRQVVNMSAALNTAMSRVYYVMELEIVESDDCEDLNVGVISVKRYDGEELFSLSVAARGGGI